MNTELQIYNKLATEGSPLKKAEISRSWKTLALCSSAHARALIPFDAADRMGILPLSILEFGSEKEVLIAIPSTADETEIRSYLKLFTTEPCSLKKTDEATLRKAILIAYKDDEALHNIKNISLRKEEPTEKNPFHFRKRINIDLHANSESDTPKLLQSLLTLAYSNNASDIHMESLTNDTCRTSFRLDGSMRLQEQISFSETTFSRLIQHIKVICGLDITNHTSPQDGMFEFSTKEQRIRVRISIIPKVQGVKIAMRLLYHPLLDEMESNAKERPIDMLNLNLIQKEIFLRKTQKRGGLILLSGPTGSGKSTLLYALIMEAARNQDKQIVSIEDPVERDMPGITQIEVGKNKAMSYEGIFKSTLRQDPDMVILSEIREAEALNTALQASLSGTTVISTIHASNVIELILRLFEMGCSPISLGASLKIASSQRLLKKNCPHCKISIPCPEELQRLNRSNNLNICYHSTGCNHCDFSGVAGRIAIYETCEPIIAFISELYKMYSSGFSQSNKNDLDAFLKQSNYLPFSLSLEELLRSGEISPETASTLYF